MSKKSRDYQDSLCDIVEAIRDIEAFIKGMEYDQFFKDHKTLYAVIRALEIIGEAAKNISQEMRQKLPQIPWKEMAGLRDILIHHYFRIKAETVWETIKNELSRIKPILECHLLVSNRDKK